MSDLVVSQPAKVGDKLVTVRFPKAASCGFAFLGKPDMAVCLPPGAELAFEKDIRYYHRFSLARFCVSHKIAMFRQFGADDRQSGRDALELPDGRIIMLTELVPGQTATVYQLPPSTRPVAQP